MEDRYICSVEIDCDTLPSSSWLRGIPALINMRKRGAIS